MRRHLVLRHERAPVSARIETGSLLVLLGALGVVIVGLGIGIAVGDYPLDARDVVGALIGQGSEGANFIVLGLRLPRLLAAFGVGALLGMSGALLQSVARNPLASPDIVGITGGASLAVVALVVVGPAAATFVLPALLGGLVAGAIVLLLSWDHGLSRMRFVLIGIGVNAACLAGVDFLLTRGQVLEVQEATVWIVGSLAGAGWDDVRLLGLTLVVLLPAVVVLSRHLQTLRLGDDVAAALGSRVVRDQLLLAIISVAFAAVAVSIAGPIAFVAFVAPHVARSLSRAAGSGVVATSAVVGAAIVVIADLVARRAFAPAELPVGLFTVLVGAPYLLWLLRRRTAVRAAA